MKRHEYVPIEHRPLTKAPKLSVGDVVGRFTLVSEAPRHGRRRVWLCRCTCGTEKTVLDQNIRSHRTISCGCLSREVNSLTLPGRGGKAYRAWADMLNRCRSSTNPSFKHYGGRGIKVDPSWEIFDNFYQDMGEPEAGLTLERIDNSMGYGPNNCEWRPMKDQQRNKRTNRLVTIGSETLCVTQWAERSGINEMTLRSRLKRNVPVDRLLEPVGAK